MMLSRSIWSKKSDDTVRFWSKTRPPQQSETRLTVQHGVKNESWTERYVREGILTVDKVLAADSRVLVWLPCNVIHGLLLSTHPLLLSRGVKNETKRALESLPGRLMHPTTQQFFTIAQANENFLEWPPTLWTIHVPVTCLNGPSTQEACRS